MGGWVVDWLCGGGGDVLNELLRSLYMGGWVKEKQAVGMSYCGVYMGK